jgi:tRNA/tmRNA/rRNA uracil-C5-methylase (TrmA/RlmC/RlmD family)
MYKFNPQHIAALSGGKAILAHTKKKEDLPLLRAVLKKAFPKDDYLTDGNCEYYLKGDMSNKWHVYTRIPKHAQHLPIIPLHDFLDKDELPKEDLDRVDLMDKRLKELSEKYDRLYGAVFAKDEIAEPKEELLVKIRGDQHGNHNYIQVSNGLGGFTQDQADQTADLIKWVLDNQETVLKIKNNE